MRIRYGANWDGGARWRSRTLRSREILILGSLQVNNEGRSGTKRGGYHLRDTSYPRARNAQLVHAEVLLYAEE